MNILIFGAGVLGSLYAARLKEAGNEVSLIARGKRYRDLEEHGIVLEHFKTKEQSVSRVRLLESMPADEPFDICLVLVQNTHLDAALPELAKNRHIPSFLFFVNYLEGLDAITDSVGRQRVMLGHVNAGGERDGHMVRYMTFSEVTLGELEGKKSDLLLRTAGVFKKAGFPVRISPDMDSWKRHHLAFLVPFCNAMYICGCSNYQLAKDREALRKSIRGAREAMRLLEEQGHPVQPGKLKFLFSFPEFILLPLFKKVMNMELMDIGGARHARSAWEEMRKFSDELIALADRYGRNAWYMRELHRQAELSLPPAADAKNENEAGRQA